MAPKTLQQLKQQRQKEHEKLAAASAEAGKSAAAAEAAAIAKRSFAGGKAGKVEALKEEANASFHAHDYPRALELYNQALLLDGKNALLYCNRSAAYCALRNFTLALKDAESALRWAPNSAKAHYRRGYAFEQLWRYADAFEEYCAALRLEPKTDLYRDAHADMQQLLDHLKLTHQSPSALALAAAAAKGNAKAAAAGAAAGAGDGAAATDAKAADASSSSSSSSGGDAKGEIKDSKSAPAATATAATAKAPVPGPAGEMDRFDVMVKWLRDGGAKFPKLYLQYYDEDYRGVHTVTKINTDENVVFVPLPYIMTSELARDSEICKQIDKSGAEVRSKHSYLAAFLLQEKSRPHSHWQPYIRILPAHYNNVPINFDAAKKRWLRGSMCVAKINERIEALKYEYGLIAERVPAFAAFGLEQFVWARLVVITRIFGLVINGVKTDGLVPYADMLNHKRPRETKWAYDDAYGGFLITALKTIHRADQVFDSYGRKCNSRFFVNYGFALDSNRDDNEALLHVALRQDDALFGAKLQLFGLQPQGNGVKEYQVPATYAEAKSKDLFSFLRVAHATPSELQDVSTRMRGREQLKLDNIDALSPANEIAVLSSLRDAALQTLAGFDTSLDADNALLAEHAADPSKHPELNDSNVRNCVVVRRGEKEVLQWYVELCERATPYLRMSYGTLCRRAAEHVKNANPFDEYVMTVVFPLLKRS